MSRSTRLSNGQVFSKVLSYQACRIDGRVTESKMLIWMLGRFSARPAKSQGENRIDLS